MPGDTGQITVSTRAVIHLQNKLNFIKGNAINADALRWN